jgi:tRNA(adenine34) deaminase
MIRHEEYMKEALKEARNALKAGEFPVGCVMVYEGELISRGRRINSIPPTENEMDHAEIVALRKIFDQHPEIDRARITVYSTMEPCLMCYVTLLLNGIRNIVYGYEDIMGGGTNLDLSALSPLYREISVDIIPHIMRRESLALFKTFFSDTDKTYWQDSPLARYTLEQLAAEENR